MHTDSPHKTDAAEHDFEHDFEDDWTVWQEMAAANEPTPCAPDEIDEWLRAIAQEITRH